MEKIKKISIEEKDYPELLKKIKNPPKILFYRGSLPQKESKNFAVVGTRRFSGYGRQAAFDIAGDLAEAGLIIVSGLAPGIDTFAHQAAIERGGKTIAVLGTGPDQESIYPRSNLRLAQRILETGGWLVSEYQPGTQGSKFTFPRRNRIIAGLSLATLVIEAKERSGALITARHAFEEGKKVFALPGSIYSLNSKGPHSLIKNGAKLAENANDILKELNFRLQAWPGRPEKGENKTEDLILKILKEEALYVDKIIQKTNLPAPEVASSLAILEIKGKVKNLGGNVYVLPS